MRRTVLIALVATVLGLGTGISYASIPDSHGVIHGCYVSAPVSGLPGALRVIDTDKGQACTKQESPVSWNQQGPPGQPGSSDDLVAKRRSFVLNSYLNNGYPPPFSNVVVASLNLPAGSYEVFGRHDAIDGSCQMNALDGTPPSARYSEPNASPPPISGALGRNFEAFWTLNSATSIQILCSGGTASLNTNHSPEYERSLNVPNIFIIARQVSQLNVTDLGDFFQDGP